MSQSLQNTGEEKLPNWECNNEQSPALDSPFLFCAPIVCCVVSPILAQVQLRSHKPDEASRSPQKNWILLETSQAGLNFTSLRLFAMLQFAYSPEYTPKIDNGLLRNPLVSKCSSGP